MLRRSSLFHFKHGDHTCVLYRSEDALMDVLTPYVAEGLRNGERCFCVQKPQIGKRLLSELRALAFNVDDLQQTGALEIHRYEEVYFCNGTFQPRVMMDMLMRSLNEALQKGFSGFRTAGDLSWAVNGRYDCTPLIHYEGLVNGYYPGRPVVGLCQYDTTAFSPRMLESVIANHGLCVTDLPSSRDRYSCVSLRHGNFWYDVVAEKLSITPSYYYVAQRRKPAEIVGWGVSSDFDRACAEAEEILRCADN